MNKQRIYCFLLLLLCGMGQLPSTAQQYFNKRYTLNSGGIVFTSALQKNEKYYVVGICNDSINYLGGGVFKASNGIKFNVVNNSGEVLSSELYQRSDKIHTAALPIGIGPSSSFFSLSDSTFIYAFTVMDTAVAVYKPTSYNFQAAVAKFDSIGNVLMYKEYDRPYCDTSDATNYLMRDFKPDVYGNWLMLTSMLCNGNKIVFNLRKLDSAFNEVWVKNFSTSSLHHTPKHLLIEADGYVMTGGIDNGNTKLFPDYYTSVLIKCDTAGNQLWDWQNTFDTTRLQYIINDIIRTKDGGYVYCGTGEGRPTYFDGKTDWAGIKVYGIVEKLDASRNSVWKRRVGYLFAGVNQNAQTVLKELPNGDIIVAGTMAKYYDEVKERGNTKASLTKLSGVDGSIIWQRIYDYTPDTLSGFIYDMRQTADGGYILVGETKDDAVFPFVGPIQRGWLIKVDSNGCEWAGSPCNPTHISPIKEAFDAGFTVYPNPSKGTLVIARHEAIYNKQSETINTKIFDLLGRIIHQQSLHFTNKEATLNLNLPSATYILELKDEAGIVQRERIVIE